MSNTETSPDSVHGHEVLHLLYDQALLGSPMTRASLAQESAKRWGAEVRFHTCSAERLTLDQLLLFLSQRGKITERDGKLIVNIAEVCDHD